MASTNITQHGVPGTRCEVLAQVTLGTYATSGEAWNALTQLKLETLDWLQIEPTVAYKAVYDRTNAKILVYNQAGTQVTNATDLSAVTLRVYAKGRKA